MKRSLNFWRALFILLLIIASIQVVYAAIGTSSSFGGEVTKTKAGEIERLENAGYTCLINGSSIEIRPQKSLFPSSYVIPLSVRSKTNNQVAINQGILGKYQGKTTVKCEKECPPPPGNKCISMVTLDTITMYGNSKR